MKPNFIVNTSPHKFSIPRKHRIAHRMRPYHPGIK